MTILTNDDLTEIIRILDSSPYEALHIKTAAFELSLRRGADGWTQERRTLADAKPVGVSGKPAAAAAAEAAKAADADVPGLVSVRAPMVGIFYRAPKPGAAPFVDVGAAVDENAVIGIIETMKLMNSVPSGAKGTVVEILVANGAAVEAGQTLMRLKP